MPRRKPPRARKTRVAPKDSPLGAAPAKAAPKKSAPFVDYHKYLKSEEWAEFRKLIFEWRGRKCQLCLTERNLHLHHMTYKRLGKEDPRDVLIVCDKCHKFIHDEHEPLKN